jgi:hypothetical protein
MPDPLEVSPVVEQTAATRQALVASTLLNFFAHRLHSWPKDPDQLFGSAARLAVTAADHADAAAQTYRVNIHDHSQMVALVNAVESVVDRADATRYVRLIRNGKLTGWGEQVVDAIIDTLQERAG